MLGWINDCIEKLVINKFSIDAWHQVKQKAKCDVKDGGFLKLEHYSDKSTIDLVVAASEVAGLTVDQVLEAFGAFFVPYIIDEGYEGLLCCQGNNLKSVFQNINAIHEHLQTTFPKKMIMPEFWCEECPDGSLVLHYHSKRGNLFAPVAVGLITELARFRFELDIVMDRFTKQGVDGAKFTSWKVTTKDPNDLYRLTQKKGSKKGVTRAPTIIKCPITGMTTEIPRSSSSSLDSLDDDSDHSSSPTEETMEGCPHHRKNSFTTDSTQSSTYMDGTASEPGGLSSLATKKLFPYHVLVNDKFVVVQVGRDLPRVLHVNELELVGKRINEFLEFVKPLDAEWSWGWLRKLEGQSFTLEPILEECSEYDLRFKASLTLVSENPREAMVIICPDANNLDELREMHLTLSDLPVHGSHRDAVFLREHLSTQMNNALKMEKLSKSLEKEKALLEQLLPQHAAEGLRMGKTVEPRLHNNVTMFFCDVVAFTKTCKEIYPWEVIEMLNRLYCVMDHLALKFNVFKIETIGDSWVGASGLPESDDNHAENVASFAVAVNHCCRHVLSPLDNKPIQLRIGIHTGPCASGVVGVTNQRYCVFGDTVNVTARHESTGDPGKIHCSNDTQLEIQRCAPEKFKTRERGLVEMKGKGKMRTYWLEARPMNKRVNKSGLKKLDNEVESLLKDTNFDALTNMSKHSPRRRMKSIDGSTSEALQTATEIDSMNSPHKEFAKPELSNSCASSASMQTNQRMDVSNFSNKDYSKQEHSICPAFAPKDMHTATKTDVSKCPHKDFSKPSHGKCPISSITIKPSTRSDGKAYEPKRVARQRLAQKLASRRKLLQSSNQPIASSFFV